VKTLAILLGAAAVLAVPFAATADPVAARKALMRNNAGAAALAGAVREGNVEYHPVIGRAVIASLGATAATIADFFPEGTVGEGTRASPAIWEDHVGFLEVRAGFQAAVAAARTAAGSDGFPTAEAFDAATQPIFGYCGACHQAYRTE
jgi:cytochrome c556